MKTRFVAVLLSSALAISMMTACGGSNIEDKTPVENTAGTTADSEDTDNEIQEDTDEQTNVSDENFDESDSTDISFVDGFYANNGPDDFMVVFYESSDRDVAYINDGTDEAFAEYTVENAELDDGTPYLIVTVGNLTLGYYENDDAIYMVDAEGNTYEAARLSEAEAEELYARVSAQ